jgi:hypothetical protein
VSFLLYLTDCEPSIQQFNQIDTQRYYASGLSGALQVAFSSAGVQKNSHTPVAFEKRVNSDLKAKTFYLLSS